MSKKLQQYLTKIEKEGNVFKVIITQEVVNNEAAYISVDGMEWRDDSEGVPFIDAHNQHGSIVENLLGRIVNLQKTERNGVKMIVGDLVFADTPNGRIAKELYETGMARDVSVGIMYYESDVDPETEFIQKSKLYEVSGVIVGANEFAKVIQQALMDKPDLNKLVNHYNDIKPRIKAYREAFMTNELFKLLEIEKTGDEVKDIEALAEKIQTLAQPTAVIEESEDSESEIENQSEGELEPENQEQTYVTVGEAREYFKSLIEKNV